MHLYSHKPVNRIQVLPFTSGDFTSQTSHCCWSVLAEWRAQNRTSGWTERAPCWYQVSAWSFPENARNRCERAEEQRQRSAHESPQNLWKWHFLQMKEGVWSNPRPENLRRCWVVKDYKQPSSHWQTITVKYHLTCPVSLIMILSLWRSPMPRT